jgi:hypothetical protein
LLSSTSPAGPLKKLVCASKLPAQAAVQTSPNITRTLTTNSLSPPKVGAPAGKCLHSKTRPLIQKPFSGALHTRPLAFGIEGHCMKTGAICAAMYLLTACAYSPLASQVAEGPRVGGVGSISYSHKQLNANTHMLTVHVAPGLLETETSMSQRMLVYAPSSRRRHVLGNSISSVIQTATFGPRAHRAGQGLYIPVWLVSSTQLLQVRLHELIHGLRDCVRIRGEAES